MGFEALAVDHVNGLREQTRDEFLDLDVIEDADMGVRIELDEDVDIAVGVIVAASGRAEQRSMADAPRSQSCFRPSQSGQCILRFHGLDL